MSTSAPKQRTYAPETLLNHQKAAAIIKSGTLQPHPCSNCERMKLECFLDTNISNLCQYCVERKQVCSNNPKGRRGVAARKPRKREELQSETVQREAAEGPQSTKESEDDTKPKQEVIDISLVPRQTSRTMRLPAGEYQTLQVVSVDTLRTAVLLPLNPAWYGMPAPKDAKGVPLLPTPIIRSVVPKELLSDED